MSQRIFQLALLLTLTGSVYAQRGPGGPPPGGGGRPGPGVPGGMSLPGGPGGMHEPGRGNEPTPGPTNTPSPIRSGPQLGPPGRWWDDKKVSKSLKLSTDQQQHMDDIFNANKAQLVTLYSNLQREEQKLGSMSSQELQDETRVFASIDRVAQARAELEKENAHILLQIRGELSPDQLNRLDKDIASK